MKSIEQKVEHSIPYPKNPEPTIEEPTWSYTGWCGTITFPGGATAFLQGDDADCLDDQVGQHGVEILWNYLGIAQESGADA